MKITQKLLKGDANSSFILLFYSFIRGLLDLRLLPLLLAPFPSRPPPSLSDPLLATLALTLPLDPITLEQLGLLLALLLPGLEPTMQQFLNR